MDQTPGEFLVGIEELVEQVYVDLDALHEAGAHGRGRRELIDQIFRRVHSLKGSAATCGLKVVSQIAHEFENLLDAVRSGRVALDDSVWNTCESATDALSESLRWAASGIVEPSHSDLFERLQAVARGMTGDFPAEAEQTLNKIPAEVTRTLSEPEKYRLISAMEEGSSLYIVAASFDLPSFDEEFVRMKARLAEWGEVISTSPAVSDAHPNKINFRVLYASALEATTLETNLAEFSQIALEPVGNAAVAHLPRLEEPSSIRGQFSSVSSLANFVRTDLDTLDRLISSTHQLFRGVSNALELAMIGNINTGSRGGELQKLGEEIKASFLGVEDELINLRMVSLAPTLQRAIRAGKTAARLAGKEIDFEVNGGELRLDKLLADTIVDPLIHLIRNAVDHGIESTAVRTQAGKRKRGTVRVEAVCEGGRARVAVTDDGRGIDPDVVSAAAKRLGMVEFDTEFDFERSLRLIFRPGFTTADLVSDISGRGVGLDVVETAVEQAGGELRVATRPGIGTTFEIRLPVTFGLLEARIVRSGEHRYCIAASQILTGDEAGSAGAHDPLPQISMRELLGQSPLETQTVGLQSESTEKKLGQQESLHDYQLISCRFSDEREANNSSPKCVGIIVDNLEGTEKVLVRGLGRHAGRWLGVAGATELSDGSVALVLDLPRLVDASNHPQVYGKPSRSHEKPDAPA